MNKTLKTVLITLAVTFVFLVAVVMIFGEDTPAPAAKMSQEVYAATLAYDIFDWNRADEQGKIEMAKNIISIWNESGNSCELSAKDLAAYISQNLHDQANVFEVACIAAQIDPQPYLNRNN